MDAAQLIESCIVDLDDGLYTNVVRALYEAGGASLEVSQSNGGWNYNFSAPLKDGFYWRDVNSKPLKFEVMRKRMDFIATSFASLT